MAKKSNRQMVTLKNRATGTRINTYKNIINTPDKLELKKFDPKIHKMAMFTETKVKLGG